LVSDIISSTFFESVRRAVDYRWVDRALFIWLYRRCTRISRCRRHRLARGALASEGFAGYWRWKSRSPGERPPIVKEVRDLSTFPR
jgi:hypothetical protein